MLFTERSGVGCRTDSEKACIEDIRAFLETVATIPCTSCRYCTKGCPRNIPIPDIFKIMNNRTFTGKLEETASEYEALTVDGNGADACIKCRQCENVCPQHIKITDELEKAVSQFKGCC